MRKSLVENLGLIYLVNIKKKQTNKQTKHKQTNQKQNQNKQTAETNIHVDTNVPRL